MKLARLLELDVATDEVRPLVRADVFGDAFLLARNPLYRRVRELGVAAGVSYRAGLTDAEVALPLARLEIYLAEKTLPYTPNRPALLELPLGVRSATEWSEITDSLRKTFLFHETAHALFRAAWPADAGASVEATVVRVLCEESFVNAVEMLGLHFAEDAAHRAFYEANSYFYVLDARAPLKNAIAELGFGFTLAFATLAYLRVNAFQEELRDPDLDRMLKLAGDLAGARGASPAARKALRALAKICAELNPSFRENTTSFHFRLLGLERPLDELLDFDVLAAFKTQAPPKLGTLIAALTELTGSGGR